MTTFMPHPMGTRANASRPKGINTNDATAHGITQSAVTGTAIRLAANP